MPQYFPWPQSTKTSAGAPVSTKTMVWNGDAMVAGTGGAGLAAPNVLPAGTPATLSATPALNVISGGSGTTTFTLPTMAAVAAADGNGQQYIVKDNGISGTSTQTIAASVGTTIDGNASITLTVSYQSVTLIPNTATGLWSIV